MRTWNRAQNLIVYRYRTCVTQSLENLDNRITQIANSSSVQTPQVVLRGKRVSAAAARVIASRTKGAAGSAPRTTSSSRPGNTPVGSRETQPFQQRPIPSSGPTDVDDAFTDQRGGRPPSVPQMSQDEYDTAMKLYRVRSFSIISVMDRSDITYRSTCGHTFGMNFSASRAPTNLSRSVVL